MFRVRICNQKNIVEYTQKLYVYKKLENSIKIIFCCIPYRRGVNDKWKIKNMHIICDIGKV